MSMNREEAINRIENHMEVHGIGEYPHIALKEALDMAITALRPVSRERVEKVWPGCDICRGDKKIKSDNFCGASTMQIVGDSIDLRGDEKKIKFFGHIYAPSFSVRFCPFCGKPLTDEAVDMVMEKINNMEEMTNEH